MAYMITKDGKPTYGRYASELDVLGELHRRVGYSAHHAITHEGYGVVQVPADKWSELESRELRATAWRMFADHGHVNDWSPETRDSCGACALNGYRAADTEDGAPNYAGWSRLYVQAGRTIPAKWFDAFQAEQREDNAPYRAALALDVATFGVHFGDGVAHVWTHADNFGVWHAEVMIIGTGNDRLARDRARKAIMAELAARSADGTRPAFRVRLAQRVSRDETLTYHYVETAAR